jgi:hypothetical protein
MDTHGEPRPEREASRPYWKTPLGWAFIGFAAIALFFLITQHTAHVFGVLPYLLLLLCPLMHFFGHGHGGHGEHRKPDARPKPSIPDGQSVHQHQTGA